MSPKLLNGPAKYRSGWEKKYMQYLDDDPTCVSYMYEHVTISYVSNARSGRIRKYIPDLLVNRCNDYIELVEIKPSNKVNKRLNLKKYLAANKWCEENNVKYVLLTEVELKTLGVL